MAEDSLTVYNNIGRRSQKLKIATEKSQTIIDLPQTFLKSTLIALFNNLRLVPHEIKGTQLILNMPTGIVTVIDEKGNISEGTLDSLNGTEAILHESTTDKLLRINNYQAIEFEKRFKFRSVLLSYLLNGLSWSAQHTVLLDLESSRIILFKTMAAVKNSTGIVFSLSSLKLGVGNPDVAYSASDYYGEEYAHPSVGYKRIKSSSMISTNAAPMMLAAAPMGYHEEEEKEEGPNLHDANMIENEGIEDFEYIDLGPQTLSETGNFDILSLVNLPVRKLYFYHIYPGRGNTNVETGYRLIIPDLTRRLGEDQKSIHIAAGKLTYTVIICVNKN